MIITLSDLSIAETCACFHLISEAHKIITLFEGLGRVDWIGKVDWECFIYFRFTIYF